MDGRREVASRPGAGYFCHVLLRSCLGSSALLYLGYFYDQTLTLALLVVLEVVDKHVGKRLEGEQSASAIGGGVWRQWTR